MSDVSLVDMAPAAKHRAIASDFEAVAAQVPDWSAPAPVPDWTARDVVAHLTEWLPAFLSAGGVQVPAGPPVSDDPVAAWRHQSAFVQELLDDPVRANAKFNHPRVPPQSLEQTVSNIYVADVFMHTWDLAQAAGIPFELDTAMCEHMLAGMAPIEQLLRESGQYGPAVPVPADASATERLMGFVGRDPAWATG